MYRERATGLWRAGFEALGEQSDSWKLGKREWCIIVEYSGLWSLRFLVLEDVPGVLRDGIGHVFKENDKRDSQGKVTAVYVSGLPTTAGSTQPSTRGCQRRSLVSISVSLTGK